ncbi:hypothetical protein HRbin12_00987 [bacterium HR12]|nr:hypothetical protein HRbin12_00987 [bacterium HR12]
MDREAFLEALERRRRDLVEVEVPSLQGTVHVRRLRVADLDGLGLLEGERPSVEALVSLVALSLADAEGRPLLQPEEAGRLMDVDIETFLRLFAAAAEVNGLGSGEELMAGFGGARREASSIG